MMAGFSPIPDHDFGSPGHTMNPAVHEIAEEKRSKRNPRQLDFEAAMNDFRAMFPGLEVELIESILRANNGAVDDTIDQLLTMNFEPKAGGDKTDRALNSSPPLLPPKPAGSLRSSTERLQVPGDPTPALPPREGSLKRSNHKPKIVHHQPILHNTPNTRYDTEWNGMVIPMLGKLPSNFLRVVITDSPPPRPPKTISTKPRSQSMRNKIPTHLAEQPISKSRAAVTLSSRVPSRAHTLKPSRHGHITSSTGERMSSNALKRQIEANQRRLQETCAESNELDGDTERFLEDERLALIMQNEEFLRELKRNEDFMRTLEFERDMLASRLAHEQKKNRQLSQLSPSSERAPPNWMVPRASEFDENSLPRSLSPTSDFGSIRRAKSDEGNGSAYNETLHPAIVPVDRTDRADVHDFRDQLKSMGATSKKKFALLAKKFFSTSRKKRKAGKILRDAHGPSTLNLLDDNDDEDLIDASASLHLGGTDEVLFEPLPDCWTTDTAEEASSRRPETDSKTKSHINEHFL